LTGAPYIVLPTIVLSGSVGWWLRGIKSTGKIGGLEEQISALNVKISVMEQRLTLAAEQAASAHQAKDELEKQFQTYKAEVAGKLENVALAATAAKVEAGFAKLSAANNAVSSTLSGILRITEEPDIVNIRGTVEGSKG